MNQFSGDEQRTNKQMNVQMNILFLELTCQLKTIQANTKENLWNASLVSRTFKNLKAISKVLEARHFLILKSMLKFV